MVILVLLGAMAFGLVMAAGLVFRIVLHLILLPLRLLVGLAVLPLFLLAVPLALVGVALAVAIVGVVFGLGVALVSAVVSALPVIVVGLGAWALYRALSRPAPRPLV